MFDGSLFQHYIQYRPHFVLIERSRFSSQDPLLSTGCSSTRPNEQDELQRKRAEQLVVRAYICLRDISLSMVLLQRILSTIGERSQVNVICMVRKMR